MLLNSGANANLRIYLPEDEMVRLADDDYIFTGQLRIFLLFIKFNFKNK